MGKFIAGVFVGLVLATAAPSVATTSRKLFDAGTSSVVAAVAKTNAAPASTAAPAEKKVKNN